MGVQMLGGLPNGTLHDDDLWCTIVLLRGSGLAAPLCILHIETSFQTYVNGQLFCSHFTTLRMVRRDVWLPEALRGPCTFSSRIPLRVDAPLYSDLQASTFATTATMSGSVTPARRPQEDDDSEIEEFDVSVDGEGSPRSSASKRPRLDKDASEDEGSEQEGGDLLPDSFRRSPKGKGKAVNALANGLIQNAHQPGSIVRVTLTNFVTYTKAEFHPGPNLNMIIGPNGTGKSTLVCAICLGLGWATSHLGRAKDIGEFVKHGAKRATIEIELAADPKRHQEHQVIGTKIVKEGNKAEYTINGKKANRKGVQTLARSFSIQVDNLCQFLPQDRVVEFAALSSVDLLTQTQRAAAPEEMSQWHDSLKELRREQKRYENDQQKTMESLKSDQNRQRSQEADVERLRERTELLQRSAALQKLRPFPEYQAARKNFAEAKDRKKEAEKELRHLQRRLEPNLQAVNDKEDYLGQIEKTKKLRENLVNRSQNVAADHKKKIENTQGQIEERLLEIEKEKKANSGTKQTIPRLQQELSQIKKAIEQTPEPVDTAAMNEQIREKTRQAREISEKGEDIQVQLKSLNEQGKQRAEMIRRLNQEKKDLQSHTGQQVNKLKQASKDAAKAWEWIQENRDSAFEGAVYGPPVVECTVKNPRDADIVESMIPIGDMLAFTVTSVQDFKMLQQQLYGAMKLSEINIRNSMQPLESFRAPVSEQNLQQHGLQGWVLDLLDGPAPVRAMLCDNRNIHQTAYARREISEVEFNNLQRSPVSSWVTPTQSYLITRRREYGEQATSTRVQAVKKARFFTDAPIDHQASSNLDRHINEETSEIQNIQQKIKEKKTQGQGFGADYKQIMEDKKALEKAKEDKQRALAVYNGLPVKQQRAQEKLDSALASINGYRERLRLKNDVIDDLNVVKGQHCLDYANAIESMRSLYVQLYEAEIIWLEATSDLQQLQARHAEEQRLLEHRTQEVEHLNAEKDRLFTAAKRLEVTCRNLALQFDDYENDIHEELKAWEPDRLETEIESVQARLDMTSGAGNEHTLREYEQRAKRIEEKKTLLVDIEASLADLGTRITDIRERWEPRLDALVAEISDAFAENFARIQCAGEVMVHKDDDFEQWSIEIKVKFRYASELTYMSNEILTHVSQGG